MTVRMLARTSLRWLIGAWAGTLGCGGQAGSEPKTASAEPCRPNLLFSPVDLGDETSGRIVSIRMVSETHMSYMSTATDVLVLPAGADEPRSLGSRPHDGDGLMWLMADRILVAGLLNPTEDDRAGLCSLPLAGGDCYDELVLAVGEDGSRRYGLFDVAVQGDDVYWVRGDQPADSERQLGDAVYSLWHTNWRNPMEQHLLLESRHLLRDLRLSRDVLFVTESIRLEEIGPSNRVQHIVDRATNEILADTAEDLFGGTVVAVSDSAVMVNRSQSTDDDDVLPSSHTFYVARDGSHEEQLGRIDLVDGFRPTALSYGDTWLLSSIDPEAELLTTAVHTYSERAGLMRLGCFDSELDVTALALDGDSALFGLYDHRTRKSSVAAFELRTPSR